MKTIAMVDYGMGSRRSLQTAFIKAGAKTVVTSDPELILAADGVALAGAGAFPEAHKRLEKLNLLETLKKRCHENKPLFGVCLGFQLFFECSYEHEATPGLGLVQGTVQRLSPGPEGYKVPQIGWNTVAWRETALLGQGTTGQADYYYLHSYAARTSDHDAVAGISNYGREQIIAAVEKHPIYGTQFHPESSSKQGLALLDNFLSVC